MRRHENFGHGSSFGPTEIVRNAREMIFLAGDKLSLSAPAGDAEDAIADLPATDLFANRFNFAGEFQTGNVWRITRRRGITSASLQDVRAIQSCGTNSHAH